MTIQFNCTQVTLSVNAVLALLEFASKDQTRTALCGVGISDGKLAATDGCSLLRFETKRDDSGSEVVIKNEGLHSKLWSRAYVDMATKVAKLEKRDVVLCYNGLLANETFPPVAQVIPEPGLTYGKTRKGTDKHRGEPIGIDPTYLARLTKVCKACETKGAALTTAGSELDPIAFTVNGNNGLNATVVIMPMRL